MKQRRLFGRQGMLALAASAYGMAFDVVEPKAFEERDGVAIVDVCGPLTHHADGFWESYDGIVERVGEALASSSRAVVLRINSPGGEVSGCFESARALRALVLKASKPVVAFVDGMATSAAYALACAAEQIVVPPTGRVGSIGVINALVDQTALDAQVGLRFSVVASGARKTDGFPHIAITDDAIAALQGEVDSMAELFFELVAETRPAMSAAKARGLEAGTFHGAAAVAAGLADQVGTFEDTLAMVASTTAPARASEDTMTDKEKAITALKAIVAGDDKDAAKAATAALKCMGEDDDKKDDGDGKSEDSKDPPDDEKKDDGDKAEDDKDPPADDEKKKDSPGASARAVDTDLAKRVAELETREERNRLMASRPDLIRDPATRKLLSKAPLDLVREHVKNAPKQVLPKTTPAAAAAQSGVKALVGDTQAGGAPAPTSDESARLDRVFGGGQGAQAIRHEGGKLILGAMTAQQASEHLAKNAAKAAASGGAK